MPKYCTFLPIIVRKGAGIKVALLTDGAFQVVLTVWLLGIFIGNQDGGPIACSSHWHYGHG